LRSLRLERSGREDNNICRKSETGGKAGKAMIHAKRRKDDDAKKKRVGEKHCLVI